MSKFEAKSLSVSFEHINNDHVKKTIARAVIERENIPEPLRWSDFSYEIVGTKISAYTVCRDGDIYDDAVGERIARKKLMKRFMTYLIGISRKQLNDSFDEFQLYADLTGRLTEIRDDISEYLKEQ